MTGALTLAADPIAALQAATKQYVDAIAKGMATGISVKWFGALGDGVADDTAAIQAAINSLSPYALFTTSGVEIRFPRGRYKVSSSIDMSSARGVHLIGEGIAATEIFTTNTTPVISAVNTGTNPLVKASIRDMTIRGGGLANVNAHGISLTFTNRCILENLYFLGCRNCLDIYHAWQTTLTNMQAEGAGADQSYVGLYMGPSGENGTPVDNAVIATGCSFQDVQFAGYRIVNGQGSKFVSCEAGGTASYGWYIGDPPTGTTACQWMHFSNCLADSNALWGWYFKRGAATSLGQMYMTGIWTGNTFTNSGMYWENAADVFISGLMAIALDKSAIHLNGCTRFTVTGVTANQYDRLVGSNPGVRLQNSSANIFSGLSLYSVTGPSLVEDSGSFSNIIAGTRDTPTLLADNGSSFFGSTGTTVFQAQSSGDIIGNLLPKIATGSAYLGMGTAGSPLLHSLGRTADGSFAFTTNGAVRMRVGNGVAEAGQTVSFAHPAQMMSSAVAALPIGTSVSKGRVAFATDGRKNGEVSGAGTGILVFHDGVAWRACDTGATVTN